MSGYTDTTDCPRCEDEGAYFNGDSYECPYCGFIWNEDTDEEDLED
jgi:uncharacterized Zn ribbon protein